MFIQVVTSRFNLIWKFLITKVSPLDGSNAARKRNMKSGQGHLNSAQYPHYPAAREKRPRLCNDSSYFKPL